MKPQTAAVKSYLQKHNSITPLQAWNRLGIYRLAARVLELRQTGFHIMTVMVERNGRRFAKYVQG